MFLLVVFVFCTGNRFTAATHGNMAKYFLHTLSVETSPLHCSHLTNPRCHFCLSSLGLQIICYQYKGQKDTDNLSSPPSRKLTCGTCGNLFPVGRRLYSCKKSSSFTCTVTESFKQEIEVSLHHMAMSQLASFNLYQFLVVFLVQRSEEN